MAEDRAFEGLSGEPAEDAVALCAEDLHQRRRQAFGQDPAAGFPVRFRFHQGVVVLGVEGDGLVGRESPGGGRPDDGGRPFRRVSEFPSAKIRELDEDGGRGVVLVLHLGLG